MRTRGARLVLIARTPLPPRGRWEAHLRGHGPFDATSTRIRAVQRLEALGAEVLVAAADVCNLEEMRAALDAATARFGTVDAVIHAAGVVDDGPLLGKGPSSVEAVLGPKIHGTEVLDELFADGALDWMVLFSSSSTVTAPAGQVDYVAANEYLNAYAKSRRGGATRVVAIDWGIWNEVGMAAAAVAAKSGERPEAPREPAGMPLLEVATFDAEGARRFEATWSTAGAWVLDEHRTRAGEALLPGTGYLELAAEALAAHGEAGPFEIRDLYFLRPLQVDDGASREVRVRLARSDEGYELAVQSACAVDGRPAFQLNAQGRLALGALPAPRPSISPRSRRAASRGCRRTRAASAPRRRRTSPSGRAGGCCGASASAPARGSPSSRCRRRRGAISRPASCCTRRSWISPPAGRWS